MRRISFLKLLGFASLFAAGVSAANAQTARAPDIGGPIAAPLFDTPTGAKAAGKDARKTNVKKPRAAKAGDPAGAGGSDPFAKARKAQDDYFKREGDRRDAAARSYDPNAYNANRNDSGINLFGGGQQSGPSNWSNPGK